MLGRKRIHLTDHTLQEQPSKKLCSEDVSIHDDLALICADLQPTAVQGVGFHDSIEAGPDLTLHAAGPPKLDHLPNEILTRIFIYSHEPNLIHVCRNTLNVLPSYVWYSSSLAMLALLGTATVGRNKDRGPEIPSHVIRSLHQMIGPKYSIFFDRINRADLKYSFLASGCFSAAQYEVTYMRLARTVMSAALRYLHFDWKQTRIDSIRRQFARTKNMKDWQTLCFSEQTSDGQGLRPSFSVIIDSTGITQTTLLQQPVHCMKFMSLSYIPDCLLAVPVTAHQTDLIANALSFLNTASSLKAEGRPVCSRALLREALLEVIARLPQFPGSSAHKEADDTFCTLLTLDKIASTYVKGLPVSDVEIIRAVWSNKQAFYLYQLFRTFADCEPFAVHPLKFFQDLKQTMPKVKTSQDCYNVLRMELITRALLQRSGPPPKEVIKRDMSRFRAPVQSDTTYRYCRVSQLPQHDAHHIFSVAVHYSRGDRWIYWGSWHVPGAEHLYKDMAQWTTYGRKTTACILYLTW